MTNSVDNVREWLGNDVRIHDQYGVDGMLHYFLVRCQPAKYVEREGVQLLQESLEAVLPVSNDADLRENLTR